MLLRGTKDFEISISNDALQWQTIVEAILPDAAELGCNVPILEYGMGVYTLGRFLELNLKTFYTNGPGLQYIHIEHQDIYYSFLH